MSESIICPACNDENIENAHYCVSCGTNLRLQDLRDKKTNIKEFEASLEEKELDIIRHLLETIEELSPFEEELEQQIQYENTVENQLKSVKRKVEQLEHKLEEEIEDVEELETFTLTSLIARIKGDREERLSKEIEERVFATEKLEAMKEEQTKIEKELNTIRKERKELEVVNQQLQSNQNELKTQLTSIFEGENHPEDDKLEKKRNKLKGELSDLKANFNQIRSARNLMQQGYNNLNNAHKKLSSAGSYATWDAMFGGGLIVDSMKHSNWQDARSYMRSANSQIERAKAIYPGISTVFVDPNREGSDVFDIWFDNMFSDFRARDEIKNSKDQVFRAKNQAHRILRELNDKLKVYERNLENTQKELEQMNRDLIQKRLELVEEILVKKK